MKSDIYYDFYDEENSDKCNDATAFDNLNIRLIKIFTHLIHIC